MTPRSQPVWCCPEDGSTLQLEGDRLMSRAGRSYPIVNSIPRFVSSEMYVANFGAQWKKHRLTQLDSYTGLPISRDRVRRCLGEDAWSSLAGSDVIECGCGAGRFTEVLLAEGANVTSIDLSTAVEVNQENFPVGDRHRIAQADILRLPFAPQQFDLVFCLGVIQHTPDPEQTIAALYSQVKPGGWLVIDHYTHEVGRWTSLRPLYRAWLKRQPPKRASELVDAAVDFFLPLHKRFKASPVAWKLLCRVSPIVTFYRTYPELSDELQEEWARLDTHDWLTDWFKHLRTKAQIQACLTGLGAEAVVAEYVGNGVEARGRRPR